MVRSGWALINFFILVDTLSSLILSKSTFQSDKNLFNSYNIDFYVTLLFSFERR